MKPKLFNSNLTSSQLIVHYKVISSVEILIIVYSYLEKCIDLHELNKEEMPMSK